MTATYYPLLAAALAVVVCAVETGAAQSVPAPGLGRAAMVHSEKLQALVERTARATLEQFAAKHLQTNELAITLVDLCDPHQPVQASFRGDEQVYPASVVKLFYLVAVQRWMEDGKLKDTPEVRRAMRDMIVDSLNEATGFLVDCVTGTTSGPELSPSDLEAWYYQRNAVNRYFASLGYTHINVNRKPWCEGPYGREMQSIQLHKPNHRNWLTTDATARLLTEIVTGQAVSAKRCEEMMALLQRDPSPGAGDRNDQAHAFTALALPAGARLWSKAGWTSEARHDAAYVELPDGRKFVLVTFTTGHAGERGIIPAVARSVIKEL